MHFRSEIHLLTYYLNKIFFKDFDRPNKPMLECSETPDGLGGETIRRKESSLPIGSAVLYMKGSEV